MKGTAFLGRALIRLLAALPLVALPLAAQHPNVERGFAPGQAFQIGDIDHVNLFNGSLVIALPIGQTYPVGGGLSYGLTLTYSSGVWDFRDIDGDSVPLPSRTSNAGLGWRVSLGRFYPWNDPANDRGLHLYIGPDGAEHWFYGTLHAGDAEDPGDGPSITQQSVFYTRDGSYLRAKRLANNGGWTVELPDGLIHTFDLSGRLIQMADRFNNQVNVSYAPGLWTLTDSHQRSQRIYFQTLPHGGSSVEMVDRVELTAFGGGTAVYGFAYTPATIRRACATGNTLPLQTGVQLLSGVTLPDGSSYQMTDYVTSPAADCRASGVISAMVLPTLGRLEWTWQRYQFPTGSAPKAPPWQYTAGVATRAVRLSNGTVQGIWTYQPSLTPNGTNGAETELVNTVTDPLGHRTVNYFSVEPVSFGAYDYGLPFTRSVTDGAGRFLSARVYRAGEASPLRSTFVRYERDQIWTGAVDLQDKNNLNRREASQRTIYHDDGGRVADVNHSNFDGLSHYRQSQTGGSFGSGDVRTSVVTYNPGAGTYELDVNGNPKPGFTMVLPTARWLLGLYWDRQVSDGISGDQDLNCFEGSTGFLLRRRYLKTPGEMSTNDVLVVYERDAAGNLSAESYYGGDAGGLSKTDFCGALPAASQYRIVHDWDFGALATSKYDTAAFFSVRRTIDARTGLVASSFDTAGLETQHEYDLLGRRTWEKPAAGHGGWTEAVYSRAVSGTDLADVLIRQRANGGKSAAVLAQSQILFDPLGRVWREQRKLPGGSWSVRETLYDTVGNKASVSEEQISNPSSRTEFLSYDPFGRPGRIRPPDGAAHDVTLSYAGVRSVSRTVKIGTASSNGQVTEAASTTTEIYDRQGRLRQVTEPSGAGGVNVTTTYGYDGRDRLREVATTAGATTQTRAFVYDALGFLRSETYPEKGAAGSGTISYLDYDARGHFRRKIDGDTDLAYVYDRAERLAQVKRTAGGTVLKAFTYDTCTGANNWCNGKLVRAERYNFPQIGAATHTALIAETYTYGGRDGRISGRDTQMTLNGSAAESFAQSFTYYHLGQPQQLGYPQCTHTGCAGTAASPRVVENTFSEGLLASVKSGALTYGTLGYHPNLMVSQVTHANNVVETQAPDPHQMRRPASFTATLGATTLWASGTYQYDGAGNVTRTGNAWYLYDKVSRLVSATLFDGPTGGGAQKAQTYTFDPFGNMTAIGGTGARNTPTSAATNRLTGAGVVYNTRGNLTSWNGATYDYDDFNQMKRMVSGAEEWIYVYTADDERIWMKRVGYGIARWTLRDLGAKVLREYTQDGNGWTAAEDYIYRDSQLLAAETPAGRKHFHLDHLGTPRLVTNATGQTLAYHLYYPFGEEATAFNQDGERMKFTGHERDLGSTAGAGDDLDYMHARHHSPVTGRFLSVDPSMESVEAREPQSWNRYSYVQNRPMSFVDPSGAVLIFVGSNVNLRRVAQVINSHLHGAKIVIGKNGIASLVSVPAQGKASPEQAAFASVLKGVIEQKASVTIGVAANDPKVIFGQYMSGQIDIADIASAGGEPGGTASILAHELIEQTAKQMLGLPSDEVGYGMAHPFGVTIQNIVSGFQRGEPDSSSTFSPLTGNGALVTPHRKGNQVVVVKFFWVNGNLAKVSKQ